MTIGETINVSADAALTLQNGATLAAGGYLLVQLGAGTTGDGVALPAPDLTGSGNITATDKVELKSECRMVGDIKAPRILIADGASFKGNVDMDV